MEPKQLERAFKESGKRKKDLAARLGVRPGAISEMLRGDRKVQLEEAPIIRSFFGLAEPGGLLRVPVLDWVSAGRLTAREGVTERDIKRVLSIGDLPAGDWVALEVDGDSMNRIAPEGAVIVVNRADDALHNDAYYVFQNEVGEATFKRYRGRPDRFLPYSYNPDYEPIVPKEDSFRVFGRVRRVIQEV